jgi:poly-gamma-glutamate capsule biosynthesis protein CapA/YwtB (metallophosphatase superfamily)
MDKELEDAIDEVGRDKVFIRARMLGWSPGSAPPKHVWWGIVSQIRNGEPAPSNGIDNILAAYGLQP